MIYNLWPSALAKAQWAAVKMTLLEIIEPEHGYAKLPVFTSGKSTLN